MIKKKPKNKKKNKYLDNIIPSLAGIEEKDLLRGLLESPSMPKKEEKKKNEETGD